MNRSPKSGWSLVCCKRLRIPVYLLEAGGAGTEQAVVRDTGKLTLHGR